MTDQTALTALDAQAIVAGGDAIEAFLKEHAPEAAQLVFRNECEQLAELALRAGGEVYAAAEQAAADQAVAEVGLISMEALPEQGARLKMSVGLELAVSMGESFRAALGVGPDTINYVEQVFVPRDGGEPYTITVCQPGGKTPHQLRREAETERDRMRAALTELAAQFRSCDHVINREFAAEMVEKIVTEGAVR